MSAEKPHSSASMLGKPPDGRPLDGRPLDGKNPDGKTLDRPVVLVGMMGAGKSTIGKKLAENLDLDFVDADAEIEAAAGRSVAEIFESFGEAHFRDGERRVIARLLEGNPLILATGGGAFMDSETRALIAEKAISLWLRADFDVLWARVSKRSHRPLLNTADPEKTLRTLIETRSPIYAEADIIVDSNDAPKDDTVFACQDALVKHIGAVTA